MGPFQLRQFYDNAGYEKHSTTFDFLLLIFFLLVALGPYKSAS